MDQTAPDTIDLRDYLRVLARQWRLIAGLTVVVVSVALAASLVQTPVYESTAEVAIEPVRSGSDAVLEDLLLRDEIVETERRIITSSAVAERVVADLGTNIEPRRVLEMVSVRAIPNTRVVTIAATSTDRDLAAAVANSFAASYLDYRRDRALDDITAARTNLDQRARELQAQIDDLDREIGPGTSTGSLSPDDQALVSQREALAQQLAQVTVQLASLDPGTEAVRGGGEVLVPAVAEDAPVSPKPLRTGVLALVLGLMLGVGAAFLRDHFDDMIRDEDDVVRASGGETVVGRVTAWDDPAADQKLITLVDPFASTSEEFHALAANVRFALLSRSGRHARPDGSAPAGRSIAVTSAGQGEGKTSTAGNLAVAAAGSGRRVIVVDADLRKPTLARRFGLPDGVGLTDVLVNAADLADREKVADHLIDIGIPRLRVLPAGSIPPNPTELLASNQMAWLHDTLASMADLVIYDSPPVLPVADTLELAHHADLTFVVTRTEVCHRRELTHTLERLARVGAEVGGIVVNGLQLGRSRYGYGYGGYGRYGREAADEYRPRREADSWDPAAAAQAPSPESRGDVPSGPGPVRVTGTRRPASDTEGQGTGPAGQDESGTSDDFDTWLFPQR